MDLNPFLSPVRRQSDSGCPASARLRMNARLQLATSLFFGLMCGCGGEDSSASQNPPPEEVVVASEQQNSLPANAGAQADDRGQDEQSPPSESVTIQPLSLSGSPAGAAQSAAGDTGIAASGAASIRGVMDRLRPLQILLGKWRGTTRKEFDGFKAVDTHEWIWDLQTNPGQPALVMTSDKSPYLRSARLTWDAQKNQFQLTATDAQGVTREYTGTFTEPVHEIVGPDDKLHRVFRLEFTQTPESIQKVGGEAWQLAIAQQENNRYLLEVSRKRGSAPFRRYDTVSTQREGTSFALSDDDYGDKTCIISQGLGTSTVSYKGKTYWVCCSGCRAAFEEDPEKWIALAEERAKEKRK